MRSHITLTVRLIGLATLVMASVACSPADSDDPEAEQRAQEFVDAVQAAGLAPRLTPEIAASLYATDAAELCAVLDDGAASSSRSLLLGNPAHGRRKAITEEAVVFGGLIVATYCPEERANYAALIADIDPIEVSR